jgi:hypothetical protein
MREHPPSIVHRRRKDRRSGILVFLARPGDLRVRGGDDEPRRERGTKRRKNRSPEGDEKCTAQAIGLPAQWHAPSGSRKLA